MNTIEQLSLITLLVKPTHLSRLESTTRYECSYLRLIISSVLDNVFIESEVFGDSSIMLTKSFPCTYMNDFPCTYMNDFVNIKIY